MITLQHSLVYLASLIKDGKVDLEKFKENIPYILLPDALRCYTGAREYTHFEENAEGNDVSWIIYPENLKELSNENLPERHLADGIKKAVIGEDTNIQEFRKHNEKHSKSYLIESHLQQDIILDEILRILVNCEDKYNGNFTVNATGEKIDGQELRKRVAEFEKYGFLHFAKNVYEQTGIIIDQQWFNEIVKKVLDEKYPEEMSENTYKYMKIDPEIEKRIANKDFELKDEDIAKIGLGLDIEETLESMYQDAVEITKKEQIKEKEKIPMNKNKQKLVDYLNINYRTILSYGTKGIIPNGEFIVKDIEADDISEEYEDMISKQDTTRLVLENIENEKIKLVIPLNQFLSKYAPLATKNAIKLDLGSSLVKEVKDVERLAENKVLKDETLEMLQEAELLPLEGGKIEYYINDELQSSNYSICPIDLGKYRERIREMEFGDNVELER